MSEFENPDYTDDLAKDEYIAKTFPDEKEREHIISLFDDFRTEIYDYCADKNILDDKKIVANAKNIHKYFKRATGWAIKYEAMEGSVTAAFRPFIELIGDDLLKDEMEQDRERLKASIEKFYSKSDYWDD